MEIEKMREAGRITALLLEEIKPFIKNGISTQEINNIYSQNILKYNAKSAALGYKGFPKDICTSINDVVCHGIPSSQEVLKDGDIISIDGAIVYEGHYGDSCFTFPVGNITKRAEKLLEVCYETMWKAIELIREGTYIGDLGYVMERYSSSYGFSVVKDFCGHGIGNKLHMPPQIPFFGFLGEGEILKEGMCITIEPMLYDSLPKRGNVKSKISKDGWTAKTPKGELSAQYEHTILVKKNSYEVLTYNKYDLLKGKKPCL